MGVRASCCTSTLQVEQHLEFLKGLASGAHPAHWELLLRLTNAMLQSQGWLHQLSERCAQQGVELPEECVIRPPTHPDRAQAHPLAAPRQVHQCYCAAGLRSKPREQFGLHGSL